MSAKLILVGRSGTPYLKSRHSPNQRDLEGFISSPSAFPPAYWKSLNVRFPDRAHAIMASAMCLRVSWVSLSGGIFLQIERGRHVRNRRLIKIN
jgi:hypothetical protein